MFFWARMMALTSSALTMPSTRPQNTCEAVGSIAACGTAGVAQPGGREPPAPPGPVTETLSPASPVTERAPPCRRYRSYLPPTPRAAPHAPDTGNEVPLPARPLPAPVPGSLGGARACSLPVTPGPPAGSARAPGGARPAASHDGSWGGTGSRASLPGAGSRSA